MGVHPDAWMPSLAEQRFRWRAAKSSSATPVTVKLNTVERCSGHAGTYGVKAATHPVAMKIGKPVVKLMAKGEPGVISSDCPMAGHPIAQGLAQAGTPAKAVQHPLSLLRFAYGLE